MTTSSLQLLFDEFLRERQYIQNLTANTITFYKRSFKTFALPDLPLTQTDVNDSVVCCRQRGMSPYALNSYIRGINPFLAWLHENGHLETKLKLKKLRAPEKNLKTLSNDQIGVLLSHRPATKGESRLLAILALLTDSGLRINEALSLRRKDVDFENCLIDIIGKGGRFRRIPISPECRKSLFRHLQTHKYDLLFCNRDGCKLEYNNVRRDFDNLCRRVGIDKSSFHGSMHAFRRFFATYAIRRNVNPLLVQRMMGHSSLQMLNRYCKTEVSDLSANHVSALQGGLR